MLSKEAQHRILEQVSVAYPDEELIKLNKDIILAKREGYIAGAAAEATRAQQLEEVLEKILKMIQPYTPMQIINNESENHEKKGK